MTSGDFPPPSGAVREIDCLSVDKVYDYCSLAVNQAVCAAFEPACLGSVAQVQCSVLEAQCSVGGSAPSATQGFLDVTLVIVVELQFTLISQEGMGTVVTGASSQTKTVTLCAPAGSRLACAVVSVLCRPVYFLGGSVCSEVALCLTVAATLPVNILLPSYGICTPAACPPATPTPICIPSAQPFPPHLVGAPSRAADPLLQASQTDWQPYLTSPDGAVEFVYGPGTPPAGAGSARLYTGTHGDATAELRNPRFAGTRLSDLTCFVYWTYDKVNNGAQWPFIMLDISYSGGAQVDDLLFFEPVYQNPAGGSSLCPDQGLPLYDTWQRWDALHGCWWSENGIAGMNPGAGVKPLSYYLAVKPDATIVNFGALGGVRLVHGQASPEDVFDGNVDLVTIGVGGVLYTYNFEPTDPSTPIVATRPGRSRQARRYR